MGSNSKPTYLVIIIIILILSNIALGAAWWYSEKNNENPHRMDKPSPMGAYLKKEIGFSTAQLAQFDSLRAKKRINDKEIYGSIRESKQQLFKSLGRNSFSDSAINTTIEFAAEKQKIFEAGMIESLKEIRALCTEEQRAKFDTGFYKAFNRSAQEKSK